MLKIAITGSDGLIGSRLSQLFKKEFVLIPLLKKEVDITDKTLVEKKLLRLDFDLLLHLAAYTNVDRAEKEKSLAWKVNVEGTKNLFQIVEKRSKKFVYISTDFVFDGKNPPFFEDSQPNPLSWYGKTKYEGEKILQGKAMIIRLSFPYGPSPAKKIDFVRRIKSLLEKNIPLKMVNDSIVTPTYIDDIAFGLTHLLKNFSPEVFHLVGKDSLSPYQAGQNIARVFSLNKDLIRPISYHQYFKNRAPRPRYSDIRSKKNQFYQMRKFQAGLTKLKDELNMESHR